MWTVGQPVSTMTRHAVRWGLLVSLTALTFARCEQEEKPRVVIERDFEPIFVESQPATDPAKESEAQAPQTAEPTTPPEEEGTSVEDALEEARELTAPAQPSKSPAPDREAPAPDRESDPTVAQTGDAVVIGGPDQEVRALPDQGDVAVIGATDEGEGDEEGALGAEGNGAVQAAPAMEDMGTPGASDQEAPSQGEAQGQLAPHQRETEAIDAVVAEVEAAVNALNEDPQQAKEAFIHELKSEAAELRSRIARAEQRVGQLSPPVGSPGDRAKHRVLFQLDQLRGGSTGLSHASSCALGHLRHAHLPRSWRPGPLPIALPQLCDRPGPLARRPSRAGRVGQNRAKTRMRGARHGRHRPPCAHPSCG